MWYRHVVCFALPVAYATLHATMSRCSNYSAERALNLTTSEGHVTQITSKTCNVPVGHLTQTGFAYLALMIAQKSAALRLAPPMRPPSTSGLAKSSAAFLALQLPP